MDAKNKADERMQLGQSQTMPFGKQSIAVG